MGLFITESDVQICCGKNWRRTNISIVTDNGIDIAPTRRSATAMLDNRMLTGFCSSFLFLIATITNKFKRMVTGEAIDIITTEIQRLVVFLWSQVKCAYRWQNNIDLVIVEGSILAVTVLLTSILQWLRH